MNGESEVCMSGWSWSVCLCLCQGISGEFEVCVSGWWWSVYKFVFVSGNE